MCQLHCFDQNLHSRVSIIREVVSSAWDAGPQPLVLALEKSAQRKAIFVDAGDYKSLSDVPHYPCYFLSPTKSLSFLFFPASKPLPALWRPHANCSSLDQLYAYERAGVQFLGNCYATNCQGEATCTLMILADAHVWVCIPNTGLATIAWANIQPSRQASRHITLLRRSFIIALCTLTKIVECC